jgi:hypothetical protein
MGAMLVGLEQRCQWCRVGFWLCQLLGLFKKSSFRLILWFNLQVWYHLYLKGLMHSSEQGMIRSTLDEIYFIPHSESLRQARKQSSPHKTKALLFFISVSSL